MGDGTAYEDVAIGQTFRSRPGDALRVEIDVAGKRAARLRPDRGIVRGTAATRDRRDETVRSATHIVVVPRRSPPAAGQLRPSQAGR